MVLSLFDPPAEAHRRGTSRGMPYGDAGIRSYRSLADALRAIPCLEVSDPRIPGDAKRVSFEGMLDEVDFFLGQSAFQGFVFEITISEGLFAQTPMGLVIAKIAENAYTLWSRPLP